MKFYLPYILLIFLIVVVASFGVAAILTHDVYVVGAFMLLMVASFFGAAMLFFKIDEDGNE